MSKTKNRKVAVSAVVRMNAFSVISDAVDQALHPNALERFFKHSDSRPSDAQLALISEKAADAVMLALSDVLLFE